MGVGLSGRHSFSANHCKGSQAARTLPPTKALANGDSMCDKRQVNLTATREHMVKILLTNRYTTGSLLSLRIIMEHKKGHISHVSRPAAENRTQGHACLGVSGHVCSWKRFLAFEGNRQSGRDKGLNVQGRTCCYLPRHQHL